MQHYGFLQGSPRCDSLQDIAIKWSFEGLISYISSRQAERGSLQADRDGKRGLIPVDLWVAQEIGNVGFAMGAGLQALALPQRPPCIVGPHLELSNALQKP